MARLFSLIPLLCFAWTSIVQALPFHNINLPDSPKPILMHGNKSIAPAMIGGFVSECIAEFMMPTHGTDKRASHERPDYTKSQQAIVHGIAKLAPVLICAACGMNDAQISVAVNAATMALAYNHGKSVDKARKKGRANEAGEDEKEDDNSTPKTTPALTINGTEFDLMDHQPNHPGLRKRSLSLTSLYLAEKKEQARANYRAAKTSAEKDIALSRALNADVELANRPAVKATHQATDYVRDNPGKTSAYIEATLLSGGAVLAQNLTAGIFLGAAGGFIGSMASHDFSINSGKDAASIAVSTVLGGLIPAPAKLFFPAALATGVYGMNTHDSDLMWEGGLGAAFSFVPLVKEGRHSFNTGKNITVGGAHFSRSLDDSMLRPPVNSNMPIKPPANTNVMPLPHVVEPIEVNGLQKLAQELSGGAKTTKDYRQIYFSAERSRAQGLGSNGTLTLDGGTRTLNASKTGSGRLDLNSLGNGSGNMHVLGQNSEGRWVFSAGERVSAKDLGQRPINLIETTERTLASYQKMKAGRLPPQLKDYIREVESKSGLTVHPKQRELLAADLRANAYSKLDQAAYDAHAELYTPSVNKRLIKEWQQHTGRTWPRYDRDIINPETGKIARYKGWKYDAHHVNPQELGGKNEWWNMHPVPCPEHQRFVHGVDSQLGKIIKGVS